MKISCRKLTYILRRLYAKLTGKVNVHYLHIRKTGGTAIKYALSMNLTSSIAVFHLHPHRIRLQDIPEGDKVIFAVRDPVARFVSGFISRQNKSQPATFVPWSSKEAETFRIFKTANELAEALEAGHALYEDARIAMDSITHLNCFQWDWFGDEDSFLKRSVDFLCVARQESLNSDFAVLKNKLKIPDTVSLPSDDRSMNRSSKHEGSHLSARGEKNVREWYQKDQLLIELCEEWRARNSGPVARQIY